MLLERWGRAREDIAPYRVHHLVRIKYNVDDCNDEETKKTFDSLSDDDSNDDSNDYTTASTPNAIPDLHSDRCTIHTNKLDTIDADTIYI